MRGRSYSYSPSPPRRYGGRRGRSPSPRGRYGGGRYRGRDRDLPTSLLVRNLHKDCRPEDLHDPFGQFGPVKDIYLPRDYYTGEPRGFGFVQFVDPADAADAKHHMDGQVLLGRELTVVFAEENRKKPQEMRARERGRSYDYRRSPRRRSRSPRYARTYSPSPDYSPSPRQRRYSRYSRSISPRDTRYRRGSYSRSPYSRSPYASRSPSRGRSYSRSPSPGYSR
ncbi:serine/arginine-rich SC35 splicing factor SCL30 [Trifolium repens]|nr:serine/arginine-rich SC35 splicing factor SCL30 [Trifolium repens]